MSIGYNELVTKISSDNTTLDSTPREIIAAVNAGIPVILFKYSLEESEHLDVELYYFAAMTYLYFDSDTNEYVAQFTGVIDAEDHHTYRAATLDDYFIFSE